MNARQLAKVKVGDRITFKAATRSHFREATRIVTGLVGCYAGAGICVRYHGWGDFHVRDREIISHQPKEKEPS